jgi:hypothetical protein
MKASADFVRVRMMATNPALSFPHFGFQCFSFFPTPSLYLRMDKGAPERFARALHDCVLFENEMSKV